MSKLIFVMVLILSSILPYVSEGGELVLFKSPLDFDRGYINCNALFHVPLNEDVPDMRDFRCYASTGIYTLTLSGPTGKVVTVFGRFDFKKDSGFLIVKKTDDKLIWVRDLERFPNKQWHKVEAKDEYGGYEAFYRASPSFADNVSSVKWGEWWGKQEDLEDNGH